MNVNSHFQELGSDSKFIGETRPPTVSICLHVHTDVIFGDMERARLICRLINWFKIPGKSPVKYPKGRGIKP